MRKLIYAILVGIAALLVGVGLTHPVVGHAAEVPVTGLSAGDAVIKDANGKVVTGQGPFDRYQSYSVNYAWQIPDGVKLAGNTSTVSVPAGLEPMQTFRLILRIQPEQSWVILVLRRDHPPGRLPIMKMRMPL